MAFRILIVSTLALLLLGACQFRRDNRPSILVIAVENLSFDSISCDSEDLNPGFDLFCNEAVRFTHAFTPSTMSQSVLSSVLTASYPFKHGVRENGADYLSSTHRTLAEVAVERGYRTAFVSGGPPILRKSGLAQGFEVFDDNFEISWGRFFRPVADVIGSFNDWLMREASGSPFLGFLFVADLQFPGEQTFTHEGELREKSVEAQLQEIGDALGTLVSYLKTKKLWDSTHVVLMGLSGGMVPHDLKSDNTQVALFFKPARSPRDSHSAWAIDRNMSLVDVGQTLFAVLGETPPAGEEPLDKVALQSVFSIPEPDWSDARVIYSESGWPKWRTGGEIKIALRQKQFLYINEKTPVIYNSLTDHMETHPLSARDPLWSSASRDILATLERLDYAVKPKPGQLNQREVDVGRMMWAHKVLNERLETEFERVVSRPDEDPALTAWWARWSLENENWPALAALGKAAHQPFWAFVGESHLGPPIPLSDRHGCAAIFKGMPSEAACEDEGLLGAQRWITEKNEEERMLKRERLYRIYTSDRIYDRIGQINYVNNVKWDVRLDRPRPPSLLELYLALPRNRAYATQLTKSLGPKDLGL